MVDISRISSNSAGTAKELADAQNVGRTQNNAAAYDTQEIVKPMPEEDGRGITVEHTDGDEKNYDEDAIAARKAANELQIAEIAMMKKVSAVNNDMATQRVVNRKSKISAEVQGKILQAEMKYQRMGEMYALWQFAKDPEAENKINVLQEQIYELHRSFSSGLSSDEQDLLMQAEMKHQRMGEMLGSLQFSKDPEVVEYAKKQLNVLQEEIYEVHSKLFYQ